MVSIWFFCTFILKSLKNHTSSGTKIRHPPSPPALPIIGHLHLLGSVLGTSLHSLAQRYGPFVQLRMGVSTCYVVSDAEIAREVLKTNEMNFVSRLQFDTTDCNIYEGSGFITAPYNAYWRLMKKLCMTRLLRLISLMSMSTRRLGDGANNEAREIKDLVLQVSLLGGKLSAGNVLGPLAKLDLFGHGRKLRIALDKFDRLVERIIKEHEEKEMKGTVRSEGMDILLEISRDPNAEMKLTKKEIKAFFLVKLINHPKVFKKLRDEINSVVGPNRLVRESDIPNLPYLHTAVEETLRLHPPSPVVLRASIEDCEINGFDKVPNPFRPGLDVGPISCKKRSWPLAATTEKPECCVKRPR
ncbi:3,9-dihydroxypterocarpan 6A-monooxygenase-like [Populus alba x Populus x berolinensis]|uniref:3,9-dihydroxypterocarpan 6A-monooxygenase-like n=1 Tax=Populus alba x Populus x berolinensis TaxID=444605 RepID=A0AAD6LKM6_9ROSI|nr:3,9-dihydroxypterocarpan 6A-monooxygenase-like [Populus alba x Populus x berolinensis]